jgi:hypothetical protein
MDALQINYEYIVAGMPVKNWTDHLLPNITRNLKIVQGLAHRHRLFLP